MLANREEWQHLADAVEDLAGLIKKHLGPLQAEPWEDLLSNIIKLLENK